MEIKVAKLQDWSDLSRFYNSIYKVGHPLQNKDFWHWQYGNPEHGVALLAIHENEIIGHLGLTFSDGYAWHINLFIQPQHRKSGTVLKLITEAKRFGKQGTLSANENAVRLYRSLKWYQYYNLIRLTSINPAFSNSPHLLLSEYSSSNIQKKPPGHFWNQPGLQGTVLEDGSYVIIQPEVGGVRFVTLCNIKNALKQLWDMGLKWCDYVTSFNNPILLTLEGQGWLPDTVTNIPWLLNPVVPNSFASITFLTKEPIDLNFYINRYHADIGRIGSLI